MREGQTRIAPPSQPPIAGPLTLGQLLDRTFRLYRSRFRTFILIAGVFLLPWSLITGAVTGRYSFNLFRLMALIDEDPEALAQMAEYSGAAALLPMLIGAGGAILMLFVMLALTSQAITALRGGEESLAQSVRVAARRFWTAFGMQVVRWLGIAGVVTVMMIAAVIVFFVIGLGLGGLGTLVDYGEGWIAAVLTVFLVAGFVCLSFVGTLALLTPIAFFVSRWMVALPGIVDQGWRAVESLRESWRLTQHGVLRCFGYLVLLWVLSVVVTALPASVAQLFLVLLLPATGLMVASSILSVIGALLTMLWQPLFAIALVLLYFDLRVRREGYDITLRVEAMEASLRAADALAGKSELDTVN